MGGAVLLRQKCRVGVTAAAQPAPDCIARPPRAARSRTRRIDARPLVGRARALALRVSAARGLTRSARPKLLHVISRQQRAPNLSPRKEISCILNCTVAPVGILIVV